ncbi:MAG TPA: transcriptional regulator [Myxococcota bacterium]|nr:transcriptional regulator [Myxococcota bacterium]HOH76652.1 transcriptional regulator [Myxococcota bacterium]
MTVDIRPIKTIEDHAAVLKRIGELWNAPDGTEEADELDILATLVEAWERVNIPIEPPDPVDALLFRMDQMGLTRRQLEPYIGSRGRVSEVLSRRRPLSLAMIRRLHAGLGIPAEVLIGR